MDLEPGLHVKAMAKLGDAADVFRELLDPDEDHESPPQTEFPGAPKVQLQIKMWGDLLSEFLKKVRGRSDGTMPTAKDINDFLRIVPSILESKREDGKISYNYVAGAVNYIKTWLSVRFPGQEVITPASRAQFEKTLNRLLREGKLTTEPMKEPLWVTSDEVVKLVKAFYNDAVENGTISWDYTISRAASILLPAVTSSRVGEIAKTWGYEDEACLLWRDITICADDKPGSEGKLIATFRMAAQKGSKQDRSEFKDVAFREITDPVHKIVCPITTVLILGLRVGAVYEKSWDGLIANLRASPGKKLRWKTPDRPVICAMLVGTHGTLDLDNPASTDVPNDALAAASRLVGLVQTPTVHDLRRGSAFELQELGVAELEAAAMERVRTELHHTESAMARGITRRYIGSRSRDTWQMKLASPPDKLAKHRLDYLDAPLDAPPPKRRRLGAEITQFCISHGLDPKNKASRTAASVTLSKLGPEAEIAKEYGNDENVAAMLKTESDVDVAFPTGTTADNPIDLDDSDENVAAKLKIENDDDDEAMPTGGTADGPVGHEDPEDTAERDQQAVVEEKLSLIRAQRRAAFPMEAGGHELARFLSTVNIYRWEHGGKLSDVPQRATSGNSKTMPTRLTYPCPNEGCDAVLVHTESFSVHVISCSRRSNYIHQCDKCNRRFVSPVSLRDHIRKACGWVPRRCPEEGCSDETLFQTWMEYDDHRQDLHRGWVNRSCPVPDCPRAGKQFSRIKGLRRHVRKVHPTFCMDELNKLLPALPEGPPDFKPQPCSYPGCDSTFVFATWTSYIHHGKSQHKVFAKEMREYVNPEPDKHAAPQRLENGAFKPQVCI